MIKSPLFIATICCSSTQLFAHITSVCECPLENRAYNPPLMASACHRFSAQIDSLYYKANHELTPYIEYRFPEGSGSHQIKKTKYLDYDWNTGFRFDIQYHLPCDCWTLSGSWLHYNNKTSMQKNASMNQGVGSYINMPYGVDPISIVLLPSSLHTSTRGHATARLSLHEIGLHVSREYYVGKCVTLTPSASLKANFITSRYTQQYQVLSTQDILQIETLFQSRTDFKAVGISSGLHSSWCIGCGLSLYAQGAVTLYSSDVDLIEKQENAVFFREPGSTQHAREQFQTLTWQFDSSLGVRWRIPFHCDQRMFSLHVGWDNKYLPGMNRMTPSKSTSHAPLVLHGIRLGASLTY